MRRLKKRNNIKSDPEEEVDGKGREVFLYKTGSKAEESEPYTPGNKEKILISKTKNMYLRVTAFGHGKAVVGIKKPDSGGRSLKSVV